MKKKKMFAAILAATIILDSSMPIYAENLTGINVQLESGDEIVNIPDENLKRYLYEYDLNGDGEYTVSEMEKVTALSVSSNVQVSDLTGLEHAVNLKILSVGPGNVEDLSPLENLTKLIRLEIDDNNIMDISPLKKLVNMEILSLDSNNITDISALSGMTKLKNLYLSDNNITDISALSELMQLEQLHLDQNNIADISPIASLVRMDVGWVGLKGNTDITEEMLFEKFFPEVQNKKILVGKKQYLDIKFLSLVSADVSLNAENISWINSNPDVVEIIKPEYHIIGKKAGKATITGILNGIEKKYEIEVVDATFETGEEVEQLSSMEIVDWTCAGVLDAENTLWSVDSGDTAEKIVSNAAKYVGEVVYDEDGYWADYFVLDDDNTLWQSTKENINTEYVNKKLYTDVNSFDDYMVLQNDGDLYNLETGECVAKNIKQYTMSRDWNTKEMLLYDVVLTKDNQIVNIATGEVLENDVEQIYYGYAESAFCYLKNHVFHIWMDENIGNYVEIEQISGVDSVIPDGTGGFLIMEDGSTTYTNINTVWNENIGSSVYTVENKKASDYALYKVFSGGFIDEMDNMWLVEYKINASYDFDRSYYLAATNVRTGISYYRYVTKDNKVYDLDEDEAVCILEDVKKVYEGYYISTDDILYESVKYDFEESQQIMTDVSEVISVSVGCAVILRKDGSIWKYEGMASHNGIPYCVKVSDKIANISFNDVRESDWYYNAVNYVYQNGIMAGMTEDSFGAGELLARAQFATMLYRLAGTPETVYEGKFSDVPNSQWYTNAVIWASNNNIVSGYKNTTLFGSADNITREQIAVMMYRYAKYEGYDISEKASLDRFTDAGSVSTYAVEAMQWAVGNGIINGTGDGRLNPLGTAYRAECAVIFKGFMEKYGK